MKTEPDDRTIPAATALEWLDEMASEAAELREDARVMTARADSLDMWAARLRSRMAETLRIPMCEIPRR